MKYKASRFNIYLKNGENYIVTNTLSSSVMSLEREEFMNIKNNIFDDFSNDEIQQLNRQGLIIEADIDEISLLRNTYFSSKLDNREGHLTICPTLEVTPK